MNTENTQPTEEEIQAAIDANPDLGYLRELNKQFTSAINMLTQYLLITSENIKNLQEDNKNEH